MAMESPSVHGYPSAAWTSPAPAALSRLYPIRHSPLVQAHDPTQGHRLQNRVLATGTGNRGNRWQPEPGLENLRHFMVKAKQKEETPEEIPII